MSCDATAKTHGAYLGRKYFSELDGLRALSVLLVINVHLYDSQRNWWWVSGYRGVTIFFVLSGYLITTLALREEGQQGCLSLAAFYVRRCFRIFPLYYVTLALYCLLIYGVSISPHLREPLWDALPYYLLYLQEIPFCLWKILSERDLVFAQSWTLGAEEKFYLLWPLLAFVVWREGQSAVVGHGGSDCLFRADSLPADPLWPGSASRWANALLLLLADVRLSAGVLAARSRLVRPLTPAGQR